MAYIPSSAKQMKREPDEPSRLGLQGAPGTGKTWNVVKTAPNTIVIDFDHKLPRWYEGLSVPFWNVDFVLEQSKALGIKENAKGVAPNRRDVFKYWLRKEVNLFERDQTLVIDSWTMLQDCFDSQTALEPSINREGKEDPRVFWAHKLKYATEIMEMTRALKCNLVVIFHEQVERNQDGTLSGKLEPLMAGSFKDKLQAHFTDWFRALARSKKNDKGQVIDTVYTWQLKSSDQCNCSCSVELPAGLNEVRADYALFTMATKDIKQYDK